eukprot:Blabericola_migrator_1__9219@NODE_4945_length_926_cov_2_618161_g3102_i0_p1_GENE_NODE_4945_length_926_cov_2_618161_g3102_i0NODE_4945_length_926_cov_2_618161_g3102_i0_p1_ORF_typecomplete_len107_score13_97_NODE_4945_length_926_cov_2_618161_g3102_i0122442
MIPQPTRYSVPRPRELNVPTNVAKAYNSAVEQLLRSERFSNAFIVRPSVFIGSEFDNDGLIKYVPIELAEILASPPQIETSESIEVDVAILEARKSSGPMLMKLLH